MATIMTVAEANKKFRDLKEDQQHYKGLLSLHDDLGSHCAKRLQRIIADLATELEKVRPCAGYEHQPMLEPLI